MSISRPSLGTMAESKGMGVGRCCLKASLVKQDNQLRVAIAAENGGMPFGNGVATEHC